MSLKVEVEARETVFDTFLRVDRLKLRHELFDGGFSNTMTRELLLRPRAVGVLLFDPVLEKVVLVRQIRIGMLDEGQDPWLLELVAGMVEPGEQTHEVAARDSGTGENDHEMVRQGARNGAIDDLSFPN